MVDVSEFNEEGGAEESGVGISVAVGAKDGGDLGGVVVE